MANLQDVASRLNAKTGLDFQVTQMHGKEVLKCTQPDNAMHLTGKLQQAGFNAMMSVEQNPGGEGLQSVKLAVTIHEKMNGNYFPRSTDIETAISNLEQGKIQPENQAAHEAAKKAALEAQQQRASFSRG